jgi:hypothetical protein
MNNDKIYSQIDIYKIYCLNPSITHFYIGCTSNYYQRKALHKNHYKKGCNYKLYDFIRKNGGWDNWDFAILKTLHNKTHTEKHNLETYYYNTFNPLLNTHKCGRTHKQYLKDNYEKIMIQRKNNRLKHIEKRRKLCRDKYNLNKEKMIKISQKYYSQNKDKIKERYNFEIKCLCGETIKLGNRKKHIKTKNHSDNLKKIFSCIECK